MLDIVDQLLICLVAPNNVPLAMSERGDTQEQISGVRKAFGAFHEGLNGLIEPMPITALRAKVGESRNPVTMGYYPSSRVAYVLGASMH